MKKAIACLISLVLSVLLLTFPAAAEDKEAFTPRMTAEDLFALFDSEKYTGEWALMNYHTDVEETYGTFFRWDYREKPLYAEALKRIAAAYAVENDWKELIAIMNTGFSLPQEGALPQESAYAIACSAVEESFHVPGDWQTQILVYFSYIERENQSVWRVIFWPPLGVSNSTYTGYAEIDARDGSVLVVKKNDASSAATSIPYAERM